MLNAKYLEIKRNQIDIFIIVIQRLLETRMKSHVSMYYCDQKSCENLYYSTDDDDLYFYNGKKSEKIAKEVYSLYSIDFDNKQVLYSVEDDDKYTLYYQKGTKDAVKVEDDLGSISSARIYDGKDIYFINEENELKYAKIKGAKVGDVKKIADDVESYLRSYKKGYAFVSDVNEKSSGDLYLAYNGKVKK